MTRSPAEWRGESRGRDRAAARPERVGASTMGQLETPRRVDRYEIVREIGRGSVAVAYLARQPDLDRLVALKEIGSRIHREDGAFAERLVTELRRTESFSHPNIVYVFEYLKHEGSAYVAMEYLERGSLRRFMGKLSLAQIAGVLQGV